MDPQRQGQWRLCTVGHAALDHCFAIDRFPAQPTKTPARRYGPISGGMAANASIAAAKLGGQVRLHGAVGDDEAGQFLMLRLQACGVDCSQLQRVAGAASSVSAVIIDGRGERQIFNHRGDALQRAAPLDTTQLHGCDVLMADPRWMAGALAALRWARQHGTPTLVDGDIAPQEDLRALTALADWAVFSEAGLSAFAPHGSTADGLAVALHTGAQLAAVTLGAHGVRWRRPGGPVRSLPAFEIAPVDTNGAGDVFHAALALAMAESQPDEDAMRFACAAAALKCLQAGGVAQGPNRAEVERFLAAQPALLHE